MRTSQPERSASLAAQRDLIRSLLVPSDPEDAMTVYYALEHDPQRVDIAVHRTPTGQVDGFVAVCQTGRDLFVPLVLLRGPERAAEDLLANALQPGRPYVVITTPALRRAVETAAVVEWGRVNSVLVFEPSAYRSVVNVMVQPGVGPYRYEIRVQDRVVAAAGVNWVSLQMADIYVFAEPEYQGRGWGRAVGARCIQSLLEARLLPLYTLAQGNVASQRLAVALGFRDGGAREFECRARLRV